MIKLKRPDLNDAEGCELLQRADAARDKLLDGFKKRESPDVKADIYKAFKPYLFRMTRRKCAYCEIAIVRQPGDVEHYRPKGRVVEVIDAGMTPIRIMYPHDWGEHDHLGYFWLAYEWTNLLISCTDCNRRRKHEDGEFGGKADLFPVDGFRAYLPENLADERPLLIDPSYDDPEEHLTFRPDGFIEAKTKMGMWTLKLLKLNEESLVRERATAYRFAWNSIVDFIANAGKGDAEACSEYRQAVNEIWECQRSFSAFGRLALAAVKLNYERQGVPICLPLNAVE